MTCKEFIDRLLDFTEGDLDTEARRLCREHAGLCRDCADYLSGYEATAELCRESVRGEDEAVPELPEDLVTSILKAAGTAP